MIFLSTHKQNKMASTGSTTFVPGKNPNEEEVVKGGRRVKGATMKQLKKMLKAAGLKTTGRKAALTRRAKKAHLKMKGGEVLTGGLNEIAQGGGSAPLTPAAAGGQEGGKKRRSRKGGKMGMY